MQEEEQGMTEGELLEALAETTGVQKKICSIVLNNIVALSTKELKKKGIFTMPGICRIKESKKKPIIKGDERQFVYTSLLKTRKCCFNW